MSKLNVKEIKQYLSKAFEVEKLSKVEKQDISIQTLELLEYREKLIRKLYDIPDNSEIEVDTFAEYLTGLEEEVQVTLGGKKFRRTNKSDTSSE